MGMRTEDQYVARLILLCRLALSYFSLAVLLLVGVRGEAQDCNGNGTLDAIDIAPSNPGLVFSHTIADLSPPLIMRDFDGDGNTDILHRIEGRGAVRLLLARPESADQAIERTIGVGVEADAFVASDIDGDGDDDLVVNSKAGNVVVTLLNGNVGTFLYAGHIAVERPGSSTVADIDGDGVPDLVTVGQSRVLAFRGHGDGTFSTLWETPVGQGPKLVVAADLDGDGDVDIATANSFFPDNVTDTVSILFNHGDGTVGSPLNIAVGLGPVDFFVEDLDGDGDQDLVVANGAVGGIAILFNRGDARFEVETRFENTAPLASMAIGDIDADGLPDLVMATIAAPRVLYSRNLGNGRFERMQSAYAGWDGRIFAVEVGDVYDQGPSEVLAIYRSGVVVLKASSLPVSLDCNVNGVPDECEPTSSDVDPAPPLACRDCNTNGRPDVLDLDSGESLDANANEVPDECELGPDFVLGFSADRFVGRSADGTAAFPATVELTSLGFGVDDEGAHGWSIGVDVDGCEVVGATIAGTDGGPDGVGVNNSLEIVNIFQPTESCRTDVFASVLFNVNEPTTLPPLDTPHSVLRLDLHASPSETGEDGSCHLGFAAFDDCGLNRGDGFITRMLLRAHSFVPLLESTTVRLLAQLRFRRGDPDGDGQLGVSDVHFLLRFLFEGGDPPTCMEAADIDNDGKLRIVDAVAVLREIFHRDSSAAVPTPADVPCEIDSDESGSVGDLGCEQYLHCQ